MEKAIQDYTNYIYITSYVVIFITVLAFILFIVMIVKKRKKKKAKEQEFLLNNIPKNSIVCPSCNKKIDDDSVYCKYCGKFVNK